MSSPLNIAIIGAGPAGCMLARLLLNPQSASSPNISVTIFEGEQSPNVRSQGGTLDLHEESGLHAIRSAGLWDEFQRYARYDGEALKVADKNLLCYVRLGGGKPGGTGGRPEIDRPQLRQMLYESLPAGLVRWNHKISHITPSPPTVHFANGTPSSAFDLIIGADGAWSKTRPALSSVQPFYSGIAGHSLLIPSAHHTHPSLSALVAHGSLFAFSDGKGVFAQHTSDGTLSLGTWSVRPHDWRDTYDVHDPSALQAASAREYADWHPDLRALVTAADPAHVVPRDLYMLPVGFRWAHVPGVTLVGDAAHLATPFAGEGVNLALQDAERLAAAIRGGRADGTERGEKGRGEEGGGLDARVRAFEEDMFVRATAMQAVTWDNLEAQFLVPGAPRASIERFVVNSVGYGMNPLLRRWVLRPCVNAFYFCFKLLY